MIAILGLIILIAAIVVGLDAVLTDMGSTHHLAHPVTILSYDLGGSAGRLFFAGIIVGMVAFLGLLLLLAGMRHSASQLLPN